MEGYTGLDNGGGFTGLDNGEGFTGLDNALAWKARWDVV